MQLIQSEPNYEEKNLVNVLASLFGKAKHSIKIVTPYFLPTDSILSALTTASWSGVDVQLILPGKPDAKRYIIPINRSEYKNLLDAKCSIYEYDGFIHSKYYIIDDKYVLIGSANLDSRSLLMHFENVILINNEAFVKQMTCIYEKDKVNTHLVSEQF
jgi:cardiolipin synthase